MYLAFIRHIESKRRKARTRTHMEEGVIKLPELFRVTKDRKFLRAMISHVLKEHGTEREREKRRESVKKTRSREKADARESAQKSVFVLFLFSSDIIEQA